VAIDGQAAPTGTNDSPSSVGGVGWRIADRLHRALDHLAVAGVSTPAAEGGLCVDGPNTPTIALTVEDIARIPGHGAADDHR
jgi:hypothetical protein